MSGRIRVFLIFSNRGCLRQSNTTGKIRMVGMCPSPSVGRSGCVSNWRNRDLTPVCRPRIDMRQQDMRLKRFANVWISLLVAIGLLLAPMAAPVMAASMPGAVTADAQAMSMAEDMPCCPDQTKSKGCDSCPFVALCMLTVSLPVPSGAATLIERFPSRTVFAAKDDQLADGLGAKPPDHPPRTMI
jgi:hypothetical protein